MWWTRGLDLDLEPEQKEALAQEFPSVQHFLLRQRGADSRHSASHLRALEMLSEHVAANVAPPLLSGSDLLQNISSGTRLLPTGCDSIDQLLRGGLREGQLTEVVGESAAGKTQLCLSVALRTAIREERVAYLDSGCSFSSSRLAEMYACLPSGSQDEMCSFEAALRCITVYPVHSIWAALSTMESIREEVAHMQDASLGPRVLILDSLSAIVSPVLGGQHQQQGHALMVALARQMLFMASSFNTAVLVTNHLVKGGSDDSAAPLKPALGEHWRMQPHCRISLMAHQSGDRAMEATLMKSTLEAPGQKALFRLCQAGLRQVEEDEARGSPGGYGESQE